MTVEEVADELYALAPDSFTAARNARAKEVKAAGDPRLAAAVRVLRRPTVGAWVLNLLVRERGEEVERLLELGATLRAAQGTVGADELRALGEQRRRLTRAVARQAADLARAAGRTVSDQALAAVEETLRSAMVDPEAGAALATGLLVDTFSATGLEPVDLARVVAVGGADLGSRAGGRPSRQGSTDAGGLDAVRDEAAERALAAADREASAAEDASRRAREASESARLLAAEAGRRREDLKSELEALSRRLADLERRVAAATDAEQVARRAQLAAVREERAAVEAADRARRRHEALLAERRL